MKSLRSIALLLPLAAAWQAGAQSWDTSGNKLLSGTYYFRHVVWAVEDQFGDVGEAISLSGAINFDGNGNYTVSNVVVADSAASGPCTISSTNSCGGYPTSGTYSISASGYGFLDSLVTNDEVYGLVSNGIFIASSTENSSCQAGNNPCYNDLYIAAPVASPALSNASFNGTYSMADLDVTGAGLNNAVAYTRGSTFQITPNGAGSIPAFTATGYITANGSTKTTQSVPSFSYTFQNGAAVLNIPGAISGGNAATVLIAGPQKYLYFSPDGNFVFGGSPSGWDMIVGVRTSNASGATFSGLYYQTAAYVDNSQLASSGYSDFVSYYGAYCTGSCSGLPGLVLGHQRINDALQGGGFAYDYTYQDSVSAANGVYTDTSDQYVMGANGAVGIGFPTISSNGAQLGLAVVLKAPSFSGPGSNPYIFPTGVLNAGGSAPFTAQFAPGEAISIYGTNLASTVATDLTLPTKLGNVQVMVNGEAAPLYYVSQGQINAVIPIDIASGSIASIQVISNNVQSNSVTNFVGETQPGVFNSITTPAIQHADYSMVTSSSPVRPGETILLYLTGLGQLSGQNATNSITAYFEDVNNGYLTGPVAFAGSQSPVGGGYQMNVQVPSTISSGNLYLDISGPDAYNSEVVVPIGTGGSNASIRVAPQMRRMTPKLVRHATRSSHALASRPSQFQKK